MEAKDPCIGCPNINLDDYGYLCDLACGKRTAWLNQIKGYELGIREVVEWIKEHQMPDKPSSEPYPGLVLISKVQLEAKLKEWGINQL